MKLTELKEGEVIQFPKKDNKKSTTAKDDKKPIKAKNSSSPISHGHISPEVVDFYIDAIETKLIPIMKKAEKAVKDKMPKFSTLQDVYKALPLSPQELQQFKQVFVPYYKQGMKIWDEYELEFNKREFGINKTGGDVFSDMLAVTLELPKQLADMFFLIGYKLKLKQSK